MSLNRALLAELRIVIWSGERGLPGLTGFSFELVDESDDELHDFALLFAWEFPDFLERALHFADGAWAIGEGLARAADDELFDADAEGFGHGWEEVGARGLVAPFPEGDVGLWDFQELGELDLSEASGLAEGEHARALVRPWSLG
jgi:hypothetical protein